MRILIFLFPIFCVSQKMLVENSKVSFFSSAPLEDITAISNKLEGIVDFETGNFFFRIPITTFIFPSSLMQKHFNEKYMESEIYHVSSFKGNFTNKISISKNQLVSVSALGILNMHGVEQKVAIITNITTKDGEVEFSSQFNVALQDFKIKIPKIVRMNIADTILVNISGKLLQKQ